MLHRDVAPGVHQVQDTYVNWYIVQEGNDLTVVDCGLPRSWESLQSALKELGRARSDVKAIVLTHAHFDHVGFAERARTEWNLPVWVHEREVPLTHHPLSYDHERSRLWYAVRPSCMKVLGSFVAWGMLGVSPIKQVRTYTDGATLDVPGSPKVIFTPGHTIGHCSLLLAARDTLLAGDALVMTDPYTLADGPRMVARAATASVATNRQSLENLTSVQAKTVLTGHGKPWTAGLADAARRAIETPVK